MPKAIYDTIGLTYSTTRKADPRLVSTLCKVLNLPPESTIAEVGAGTGSYSRALADQGLYVKAIDPSWVMQSQQTPHPNVEHLNGVAEHIPLGNGAVDGVVAVLSVHHYRDLRQAFQEMNRICAAGPIAVFTLDPRCDKSSWFSNYFPSVWNWLLDACLPLDSVKEELETIVGCGAEIQVFELPSDYHDLIMGVGWSRPQIYLDPEVRAGISAFALTSPEDVADGVKRLDADLRDGTWSRAYGRQLQHDSFDVGYRILYVENARLARRGDQHCPDKNDRRRE